MPDPSSADPDSLQRLLAGYRPVNGVPDELIDNTGAVRPVWRSMVDMLAQTSPADLRHRMRRGDQYLRDAGVYYRQYSAEGPTEREWPLNPIPVMIHEDEWSSISAGLAQRADLLEKVMADLYGDNTLVRDGFLPAPLIAENRAWLRPLAGIVPRNGHYLHFVAFDIGRGPQGQWWVMGDRTQAPSGAGFALENRVATTRIFTDLYAQSNVHRLAGFFRDFRDALLDLRKGEESRMGILTPGPMNDTYYEHAYIARYLGFVLLEGEDLTMIDGELMVRTVAGPKPISLLWRRIDADWLDPLELEQSSRIGTPGMLRALREQNVTMVNAPGSGVLETRALLAFLPRIAERWAGAALTMPNIATWWCGQEKARAYVMDQAHRMTIGDAYTTRFLFDSEDRAVVGGHDPHNLMSGNLAQWLRDSGPRLVAQEVVTLSTTPALVDGRLTPRPMSLRVFLARTPSGWKIMPGGFARIGQSDDTTALAMQRGGSAADVWVVSAKPVRHDSMLAHHDAPYRRQRPGVLPSRAADNLFWLGRYVERTQNMVRLLRAYHLRAAESDSYNTPLMSHTATYLNSIGVTGIDAGVPLALHRTIAAAVTAGSHITDRFSVDGMSALSDLSRSMEGLAQPFGASDDKIGAMSMLLRKLSGFSGLVHENMYRFTGWRFMSIGRALERATDMADMLACFADPSAPDGSLDLAIEVADSAMTHRRRYSVATNRQSVIDLLALDALNPRSVIYQLNEMSEHLGYLPGSEEHRQLTPLRRALLRCHTELATRTPEELDSATLSSLSGAIASLSEDITTTYLR